MKHFFNSTNHKNSLKAFFVLLFISFVNIIISQSAPTDISLSTNSLDENNAINATVGNLSETDADGSSWVYTLVAGSGDADNSSFNIDGVSLRSSNVLDYENKNSFSVRIRVTDNTSLTYEEAFTITVNDLPNHVITFNNNLGSGSMSNLSIEQGASANLTSNSFTKTGNSFASWNTTPSGTGSSFTDASSYTMGSGDLTLYAQWTVNAYTITFNTNTGDGGSMSTQDINYGTSANLTSNGFTKTGYTFASWNTQADGGGDTYNDGVSYTMSSASDLTLYAKWTVNAYTITFNTNTGDGGSMSTQDINYGASANLTSNRFTKTGYIFASWNTQADALGTDISDGSSYSMSSASNVTLYAKWTPNPHTITFSADGGSGANTNQAIEYNVSENLDSNPFTKTGYSFAGWATTSGGSVAYAEGASYTGTSDATLYAQWTVNAYTITFNTNTGDGGSMSTQDINYGASANLTSNGFTKTGYTFSSWNTQADGLGTDINDAASYTMSSASDLTLYAKWTVNAYTITFNTNTGDGGSMSTQNINYGASANLTTNGFTKTGYTFASWNTQVDGLGTDISDGSSYTMSSASDLTLYAKWTVNAYTITFNTNTGDGGSMSTQDINYGASANLTSNGFTKTGYTFASWNTQADGAGTDISDAASYTMSSASNVTLYAKWTVNAYTITFITNTGDGGSMSTQDINYGASANLTSNGFTKTGYTFASWNTQADGLGTDISDGSSYTISSASDLTLYAKWTVNAYTISFNTNTGDGGSMSTQDINYGASANLTSNGFTKTGYTFASWNTQADGAGTDISDAASYTMSSASNVTLYAKWTVNAYTITFSSNGGDGGSMSTQDINYGASANLTSNGFTKTGYTFASWNTQADGAGADISDAASYTMSSASNVTLYAKWTVNAYTITFSSNGGDGGSMSTQDINYGASANLTSNGFTRSGGYLFASWNSQADGLGTDYIDGVSYTMSSASNLTLHAKWVTNASVSNGTGNWNDASTWINGVVPVIGQEVTINHDIIVNGTTNALGSLTVNSGKTLTMGSYTLTNSGLTNIDGTLIIPSSSIVDCNGDFDATGGEIDFTGSGSLQLSGTVTSLGILDATDGTVKYDGGVQNVLADDYYNLVIDQTGNKTALGDVNIVNDMTISNSSTYLTGSNETSVSGATAVSATLEIGNGIYHSEGGFSATGNINFSSNGILRFKDVSPTSLGTLDNTNGKVIYKQNATNVLADDYYTLRIIDAGAERNAQGNITVAGNFLIGNSSEFNLGSNNLTLTGDADINGALDFDNGGVFELDGEFDASGGVVKFTGAGGTLNLGGTLTSLGTFTESTGKLVLDGSSGQAIPDPETFYDLQINNNSNVTLGAAVNINGTLTLGNGDLITSGNDLIILSSMSGATASGHVVGTVKYSSSSQNACLVSLGDGSNLRPVTLKANANTSTVYTVSYVTGIPAGATIDWTTHSSGVEISGSNAKHCNNSYYFNITPSVVVSTDITLDYGGLTPPGSGNGFLLHYNSTSNKWEELSSSSTASTVTGTATSFSPFGQGSGGAALAIDLLSFNGSCNANEVELEFIVASQTNNDYFTIERSVDANEWITLTQIPGVINGNTNVQMNYTWKDESPIDGISYYRLSQTDFDGTSEAFHPIAVECEVSLDSDYIVYPNPVSEQLTINLELEYFEGSDIRLQLLDLKGSIVKTQSVNLERGFNHINVNVQDLPMGVYMLRFKNTIHHFSEKRIIKKY